MPSRKMQVILTVAAIALFASNSSAADKTKDLIVGKWQSKQDDAIVQLEFDKAGKVKYMIKEGAEKHSFEGTYALSEDNVLRVTTEAMEKKRVQEMKVSINKKDEMIATGVDGKSREVWKRVK